MIVDKFKNKEFIILSDNIYLIESLCFFLKRMLHISGCKQECFFDVNKKLFFIIDPMLAFSKLLRVRVEKKFYDFNSYLLFDRLTVATLALSGYNLDEINFLDFSKNHGIIKKEVENFKLTRIEFDILLLMARGYSLMRIAKKRGKSTKTVSTQKKAAMKKLDIRNNSELLNVLSNTSPLTGYSALLNKSDLSRVFL
jgi:DNA-binding CsgD family transcriptional regulator